MTTQTSQPQTDTLPKCWRCARTLAAYLSRPWSIRCPRCKATNTSHASHSPEPESVV